ncbi:HepT-like ribonuclease domain-containing protein [Geobacter argillaceus]|uniref:DUF86 domain-containing protein n=1 Tax=Geobacter argillaceus TaxID=345631 RepID=A0A562VN28_9BACT|nr:HepT-like ribonuclease domain-containing protein [Geobacter argillaceus]TWJ19309.1 hypothetical protein JN12_02000 [Geobacter argillaceus]
MALEDFEYLEEFLAKLKRARETLEYSYEKCRALGVKEIYDLEEQDRFESLTSKFARLADLIIKQAIKLIDILDLEEPPETIRDAINRAEKKGLVSSSLKFVEIRKLRNRIAHEYAESDDDIKSLYVGVLLNTPHLFDSVNRIMTYTEKYRQY